MNLKFQIILEEETIYGTFRDAIYVAPEDVDSLTKQDMETLAQERVDNHITAIETSPVNEEI